MVRRYCSAVADSAEPIHAEWTMDRQGVMAFLRMVHRRPDPRDWRREVLTSIGLCVLAGGLAGLLVAVAARRNHAESEFPTWVALEVGMLITALIGVFKLKPVAASWMAWRAFDRGDVSSSVGLWRVSFDRRGLSVRCGDSGFSYDWGDVDCFREQDGWIEFELHGGSTVMAPTAQLCSNGDTTELMQRLRMWCRAGQVSAAQRIVLNAWEKARVCLHCGYDLSSLEGDICPECGTTWEEDPQFSVAQFKKNHPSSRHGG